MRLWRKRAPLKKGFIGDWTHRIGDLFVCGVEFRGRTVLDAGCNMGILAYEIAKQEPTFIHGIDSSKDYIRTAQMIFLGVAVESRFERLNVSREKILAAALRPSYDVVLFLSVYQYIRNRHGAEAADRTTRMLVSRCRENFVLRVPQAELGAAEAVIAGEGFIKTFVGDTVGGSVPFKTSSRFHVYRRSDAANRPSAADLPVRA